MFFSLIFTWNYNCAYFHHKQCQMIFNVENSGAWTKQWQMMMMAETHLIHFLKQFKVETYLLCCSDEAIKALKLQKNTITQVEWPLFGFIQICGVICYNWCWICTEKNPYKHYNP